MRSRSRCALLLAALVLGATACSGGDTAGTTTTVASTTTQATTTTTVATPTIEDARASVVRIVGTGTFQDPVTGVQANVPGSGSGFIIDPSGLAVTNNHVVTGAAFLEVFLSGESSPRNAKIVGVSECSDLAVIDIDGEGFTALSWYDGPVTTGLAIYAAGYPLGDPEYTLLEGIVSKEKADGETSWASVDSVIEHSADTLPGNSGGPILSADGKVVAVNYAGNGLGQSFAIGIGVARPIVDALRSGEDVNSIGINGEAYSDGLFSGIWVSSVASGSPADRVGVEAGDLVTKLEGIELAVDGTMADYCDVLRSHDPTDVLSIEVYRASTDEVMEGRLNGDALTTVFSFAAQLDDVVIDDPGGGGVTYSEYVTVSDDTGSIVVDVPVEWLDVGGEPWDFEGTLIGPALGASPDRAAWASGWATPGVFIAASRELGLSTSQLLDSNDFSGSCSFAERVPYDDGLFVGELDIWEACGDESTDFIVIASEPPDQAFIVLVQIVIVSDADWDAADQVIRTFNVFDPQIPG